MNKITLLLLNEISKLISKKSTWIALSILILSILCCQFLLFSIYQSDNHRGVDYSEENLKSELSYLYEAQPDGYEAESEKIQLLLDNQVDITQVSWKLDAIERLAQDMRREKELLLIDPDSAQQIRKSIEQEKSYILAEDTESYYRKRILDVLADFSLTEKQQDQKIADYQYIIDHEIAVPGSEWKYRLFNRLLSLREELTKLKEMEQQGMAVNHQLYSNLDHELTIGYYRIENEKEIIAGSNISGSSAAPFWVSFANSSNTLYFLTIILLFFGASLIASEFSGGTSRLLLVIPAKRWKILVAKYLILLLCLIILAILVYLINLLSLLLCYGSQDILAPYLYVSNNLVQELPGFLPVAFSYLLGMIPALCFATLSFSIGSFSRNTAISVGVSALLLLLGEPMVNSLHSVFDWDWMKFLLFSNLDLAAILSDSGIFLSQNILFSSFILLLHLFLFALIAWDGFVRKDIK